MEAMKEIPDKYFELAIADPPYGRKEHGGKNRSGYVKQKNGSRIYVRHDGYENRGWDNKPAGKEYFDELMRVSKNQIIWGCNYFDYPLSGGRIIWDKSGLSGNGRKGIMRLIDVDKIEINEECTFSGKGIKAFLNAVPTAYDVDKVIARLEQQKNQYFRRAEEIKNKFGENYESQKNYGKACSYDHAIEIAKSGYIA